RALDDLDDALAGLRVRQVLADAFAVALDRMRADDDVAHLRAFPRMSWKPSMILSIILARRARASSSLSPLMDTTSRCTRLSAVSPVRSATCSLASSKRITSASISTVTLDL